MANLNESKRRPIGWKQLIFTTCVSLIPVASTTISHAAVPPGQANQLGNSLTPFGAIRAGNPEGTIPRWTGGDTALPEGYDGSGDHHVNPYPNDKPRYVVTSQNLNQHREKVSDGAEAMFRAYPDTFKIRVFPSRRSHTAPDHVADNSRRNAVKAELVNDGNGIRNAFGGHPFPILHGSNEDQAMQAMWNHLTRWRGRHTEWTFADAIVADGGFRLITMRQELFFNWNREDGDPTSLDNIIYYYLSTVLSPAQYAGGGILIHETLDQIKEPRKAWGFSAGEVRRAPSLAYDAPIASSGNLRTVDDTGVFSGALDRYDWRYLGREEMLIPYNNYELSSDQYRYDQVLGDNHLNPELTRWELHRVHVVEASLREDARHLYHKRVFYIDEDSWNIALVDQYDEEGKLWRVTMAMLKNYYDMPGVWVDLAAYHDLKARRYHVQGLVNETGGSRTFKNDFPGKRHFSPFTLRRRLSE